MNARIRRALVIAIVILVIVVLAGATYQGVATALERRAYPHPGRLIDVGGHQLHIYCTGAGVPTVVLEAPAAGMSAVWGWVQTAVAERTRVCSYDRAGLGWSEAGDGPFEPSRVPDELHALLRNAKESGPFVLGGHSLGAAFLRLYATRYPEAIAGMVLVDPAESSDEARAASDPRLLALAPWLARAGVLRATGLLSQSAEGLPDRSAGAVSAFLNRPDHLTRASRELDRWDEAVRLAAGARPPAHLPISIVRVGDGGRLALLNDARSARRVTTAILDLVDKARKGV